jgi:hypothetical protein
LIARTCQADGVIGRFKRWFAGRGGLPDDLRAELAAEGIEMLEEELQGTVLFRGYMVHGQRPRSGHQNVRAALALTERRLVVHGTGATHLEVPRGADWLELGLAGPEELRLAYDASAVHSTRSGEIEMLLRTPRAADIHARLQAWMPTRSS